MPGYRRVHCSSLHLGKLFFLSPSPSVAIVILNWNGKAYLEQFLPSVCKTSYNNYKLVVADNASNDASVDFLKKGYPDIELTLLPENFGFAKGYNEALKNINADYYVLLNSDVEVERDWLQPMVQLLEQDASNAACQPKLLSFKNKNIFEYAGGAGGWLDLFGYPFSRGRVFDISEKDAGQYNNTQQVFWASGAALMIKSHVYHQMGGFDAFFFAHQEEIDLCWRMQLAGYKVYCCPQSVVYHVGGGTLPRGNSLKTYLNFRNNHIMMAKNLPLKEKVWKIPFRLGLDWITALKGLLTGDGGYSLAILRAHAAFLKWIFTAEKNTPYTRRALKSLTGVYKGNLVWQHFVLGKKYFNQLFSK